MRHLKFILILSLLFIPSLSSSAVQDDFTLMVKAPVFSVKTLQAPDNNTYQYFASKESNLFTTEPGKAKLPVLIKRVAVPFDAENISFGILNATVTQEKLSHPILPVYREVPKKDASGASYVDEEFTKDGEFYQKNNDFYPLKKAKIIEHGEMRGLHFVIVEVYPYRYNPVTQTLEKNDDIALKVSWDSSSGSMDLSKMGKHFDKVISGMNLGNMPKSDQENSTLSISNDYTANGSVNRPTDLLTATPTDYLIITADDFYNSANVDALANHRASSAGGNYRVSIVRTSDIYNTAFPDKIGSETIDQLVKMFIKYAYDHWNYPDPPLSFVLLVGDAITENDNITQRNGSNLIPVHISTYESFGTRIATDFWYICLNGDLPTDYLSDTYDIVGDVAIGRFSTKTEVELGHIVNKTINYETVIPNVPGDWRSQVGLLSGFNINQSYGSVAQSTYDAMQNTILAPVDLAALSAYRSSLSNDYSGREGFRQSIKDALNQGRLLTAMTAHGSAITWDDGAGQIFCGGSINCSHDDISDLTNVDKPSILLSASCVTNQFDNDFVDVLGELIVKSTDAGAAAFIGSTRLASISALTEIISPMTAQLFNSGNSLLGNALLTTANNSVWIPYYYRLLFNLSGDPALNVSKVETQSSKPDLTCSLNSYLIAGNNITFHTSINNTGLSDASNVYLGLYDGDPNHGGKKIPGFIAKISLVPAGQQVSYDFTIPIWNSNYLNYVYLFVDYNKKISELSEANNLSSLYVSTAGYQENYISTGQHPAIGSNKIVWYDSKSGNNDIYMYDLGPDGLFGTSDDSGTVPITTNTVEQSSPAIYGSKIVWRDTRNGNSDIYMYDLDHPENGEVQITTNTVDQVFPAIYGNKIIWLDSRNSSYPDIYMYDLGPDGLFNTSDDNGEVRITTTLTTRQYPAIGGNKIVWQDFRNTHTEIYMYDLDHPENGEVRITTNAGASSPAIYGNKIIWQDTRNGNSDIYMYDLDHPENGEVQITTNTAEQSAPAIYGNKIVWQDSRNISYHIYMYDLGLDGLFGTSDDSGEIDLIKELINTGNRYSPKIYGSKVVFYNLSNKVYTINFNKPPLLNYIDNAQAATEELLTFTISASDPDYADQLQFTVTNQPPGAILTNNGNRTAAFSWTPTSSQIGTYPNIHFTVSDGNGGTASQDIAITVAQSNRPPVMNPIGDQTIAEGQLLTFTVSATDPDNNTLTYSAANLPTGANFNASTQTFAWTPSVDQVRNYPLIHFEVTDGIFFIDQNIAITVTNTNRAPVLSAIPNQSVYKGSLLTFNVSGSDPDNDSLQLTAANLPSGASFIDNGNGTGSFSWTPNQTGSYTVTFTISDGSLTASQNVVITVSVQSGGGGKKKIQ